MINIEQLQVKYGEFTALQINDPITIEKGDRLLSACPCRNSFLRNFAFCESPCRLLKTATWLLQGIWRSACLP
jgi:hypothetical protein